jgi:PST family polysaccharide transporter
MVILARLLTPEDFGLVGMVTAITGVFALVKEAGLSDAAVQSATLTQEQMSTLFWINLTLGCCLALICAGSAPAIATFYGEPRLVDIMLVLAVSFVFTGLATQHRAVLARHMRIQTLAVVEILALVASVVTSVSLAALGSGYWALVAAAVILPASNAAGFWFISGWVPGRPRPNCGIAQLLRYGSTVTLNSIVVYIAYNAEKVLLGRFWGAEALGIYGRAYQLITLPTESLKWSVGLAAFPALCRAQDHPDRFRNLFLRLYGAFLSMSLPITAACALSAEDVVLVMLGPKWSEVADIFRLLSPTILAFALINPLGWVLFATGRVSRSLKVALLIASVTLLAFALTINSGPKGVALGFSTAMLILTIPIILWATLDTTITSRDVVWAVAPPAASIVVASVLVFLLWPWLSFIQVPLLRLATTCATLFAAHFIILLVVFGQAPVYMRVMEEAGLWGSKDKTQEGQ